MALRSVLTTARHYNHSINVNRYNKIKIIVNSSVQQLPGLTTVVLKNGFKTTSTEHPVSVFDQNEQVLEKVLKERGNATDLPETMVSPFEKPIRKCILCEHKIVPNYKNVKLLYQFVSPYTGWVYPRNVTGLCKSMQELVEKQIRVARHNGLMADYLKEVEFLKDPKLCDPERPLRPHKY